MHRRLKRGARNDARVFDAAGFHQLEPMTPPPRETRVGLDTFFPDTGSSAVSSGPRFGPRFLALLAGYENLPAPLFALSIIAIMQS
jgi:hypothetical protein